MKKVALLVWQASFMLAACWRSDADNGSARRAFSLFSSADSYPARLPNVGEAEAGYLGLVKVYVEHGLEDRRGTVGNYVAQAAGQLVGVGPRWYVVTSRHVVVPNPKLQSIVLQSEGRERTVNLDTITSTGSRVALGSTGVQPSALWLPREASVDVAVLEVPRGEYYSLRYRPLDAHIGAETKEIRIVLGQRVLVWGFPARQAPQVESLSVIDVTPRHVVLDRALEPGYSGGIVLLANASPRHAALGIVTRAARESNQSVVLSWDVVRSFLDAVVARRPSVWRVEVNDTVQYEGVAFTFADFYRFPFRTTQPKKWWQVWK